MSGTFPGVCNACQINMNGQPMAGALLTVYAGGSTSALAATYQDIGLAIPASNPLVADAAGRLPLFFVSDGSFGLRLTDKNGVQSSGGFFYPSVPSIGASSSLNGRTIGNGSSGASERANADTQALYIYVWTEYSQPSSNVICPVVGGIGATALADFNAGKQITLLDMRGRAPFGLDDMGNAALGAFTGVAFTKGNATTGGASCGSNFTTLTLAQLPVGINSVNSAGFGITVTSSAVVATGSTGEATGGGSFGFNIPTGFNQAVTSSGGVTAGNVFSQSNNTGGQAFPSVPSAMLGTHLWKL